MRSYLLLAAMAGLPLAAHADITPYIITSSGTSTAVDTAAPGGPVGPGNYGYAPRGGRPGVVPGDAASMCIMMVDDNDHSMAANTGGEVPVIRGSAFTDLGANRNGGGHILGSWDEVILGDNVYVNAIFKTADGSMLIPPTSNLNGVPTYFWSWHFGMGYAVTFMPGVTQVDLLGARAYFSDNGGQSFTGFADISAGHNGSFLNGRDPGQYLATVGDGTNYMMLQYQIRVVPAPAALAAFGGLTLLARRRRP